jgi:hypothetical protein
LSIITKCLKCDGTRFVPGETKVLDGHQYPSLTQCPDCNGDGYLRQPVFGNPRIEKPARTDFPKNRNLLAETADWIRTHPLAADLLLKYARELASRGRRFGVKMLVERLRYDGYRDGWKREDYQVNNSHVAYIARWIIEQDPAVEKYVEFRQTKW